MPADGGPNDARRLSFGAEAELYDRARPSYPLEAARWMLGDAALRVVDLGAGTGKFSRVLVVAGHEVIAVEPDHEMRAQLAAACPGIEVLEGRAEAIPLPDGAVDAVTAAQSFHWFDSAEARAEIVRVLRPGGVLALVWNVRDDSVPWVAELGRAALAGGPGSGDYSSRVELGPLFEPAERAEFRRADEYSAESFLELVRSRSSYLTADAAGRARIDAAVSAVTARLPETFEIPYVTVAYRGIRGQVAGGAAAGAAAVDATRRSSQNRRCTQ